MSPFSSCTSNISAQSLTRHTQQVHSPYVFNTRSGHTEDQNRGLWSSKFFGCRSISEEQFAVKAERHATDSLASVHWPAAEDRDVFTQFIRTSAAVVIFSWPYFSNVRTVVMVVVVCPSVRPSVRQGCIVAKRCEIGPTLLLITNRKSHTGFQVKWKSSTLDKLDNLTTSTVGYHNDSWASCYY